MALILQDGLNHFYLHFLKKCLVQTSNVPAQTKCRSISDQTPTAQAVSAYTNYLNSASQKHCSVLQSSSDHLTTFQNQPQKQHLSMIIGDQSRSSSQNRQRKLILTHLHAHINIIPNVITSNQEADVVQSAQFGLLQAMDLARASSMLLESAHGSRVRGVALGDCVKFYEDAEPRLARLVSNETFFSRDDAIILSAAVASHRSCLDGLKEKGWSVEAQKGQNLTLLLREALAFYGTKDNPRGKSKGAQRRPKSNPNGALLASWNAATSKANFVVAQDGSGNYKTINKAVSVVSRMGNSRPERVIVYVKSGVYIEKVEIGRGMKNLMFMGDGMGQTVITGNRNVQDGARTFSSTTFGKDGSSQILIYFSTLLSLIILSVTRVGITFQNTAGPHKHQAMAVMVASDLSGRVDPNENTGISNVNSRVAPAPDFASVKGAIKSYLGRPWKKYSRTILFKTEMDGLIDPKGWTEWSGNFALSTLYYVEYMNSGTGASTTRRVRWPGFHVLNDPQQASPFLVRNFIQGESWIPAIGVPFWLDI
ncbi:unnamed protein product [Ilex paraguariensis]|uniref:Pectinesterase n=1 Tax=Ilex paraguariensis TaxID=185542 RepID=A0ABC8SBF8_9AQUA